MKKIITPRRVMSALFSLTLYTISIPSIAYDDADAEVVIDLSTQRFLGDESELAREKYFNMHDSHMSSDYTQTEVEFMQDILNAHYGRAFYSPLTAHRRLPFPSATESMMVGAQNNLQIKQRSLFPYYSKRLVVTDHPRNAYRPGRDPAEVARWAADYFEYYFDEDTRPMFYEPINEPFVHARDFLQGPWDLNEVNAHKRQMATIFREIGREFDTRGLTTKVLGYSSAYPSMEIRDFSHWETNMKMFMDIAGDYIDAISTHLYDGVNVVGEHTYRSGSNADAILDLIETYSNVKWDYTKPHAITEYGGIIRRPEGEIHYDPSYASQELPSYNHILFSLLERQDRLVTSIPFITGKSRWYYQSNNLHPYGAAMWRPDPDKIIGNKVNGFLLTEKAKFFQLWKDVRGNRVDIRSEDPDLKVQAFVHGTQAFIALNNFENTDKTIWLSFLNHLKGFVDVRIKRLHVQPRQAALFIDETVTEMPSLLSLAPSETVILHYTFAEALEQTETLRSKTYYTDEHLQPIQADQTLTFNFHQLALNSHGNSGDLMTLIDDFEFDQDYFDEQGGPEGFPPVNTPPSKDEPDFKRLAHAYFYQQGYHRSEGYATLRMSIGRDHHQSKLPKVYVNKHRIDTPNDWAGYNQINRDDFFGALEMILPLKHLKPDTQVDIVFPDSGGRVSSVVLDVETRENYSPVAVTGLDMLSPTLQLNSDLSRKLNIAISPANATDKYVTWVSSNPDVAWVARDGTVTPVTPGNTRITATTHDGRFMAHSDITVIDALSIPDTVTITEDVSDEVVSDSYTVAIRYSASVERDINLELRAPDNRFLGGSTVTVPAGEGTVDITLNFPSPLPAGIGYRLTAGIRTVDGTWRDNVDGHRVPNIEIVDPNAPPPSDPNILASLNNDFETGDLTDWAPVWDNEADISVSDIAAANNSNYGAIIDATTATGNRNSNGIHLPASVFPQGLFQDGHTYRIRFNYQNPTNTGAWAGGFVNIFSPSANEGRWASMTRQRWFGNTNTRPHQQTIEFTLDFSTGINWHEVTDLAFEIRVSQGQRWYFDNIVIEDVTDQ